MKMHLQSVLVGLLIFTVSCAGSEPSTKSKPSEPVTDTEQLLDFQNEITPDYLKPHLTAFAHDSMKGRETGTPAEKKAADFLAREYEKLGLAPVGDNGTYFQNFELIASKN